MADYLITGQRGAGKGIVVVNREKLALESGLPIATNRDLRLSQLLHFTNKSARVTRLPDFPSGEDLRELGYGSHEMDEKTFGIIDLDEAGVWLNARGWQSANRKSFLEFIPLTRKFGWHTYLTVQVPNSLDKQVRDLTEHAVHCIRTDRMSIPFLGPVLRLFKSALPFIPAYLPQVHIGRVTYGTGQNAFHVENWMYRGTAIRSAYNTRQKYTGEYPYGTYMYLPPWYNWDRFPISICGELVGSFNLWFSPKTRKLFDWPKDEVGDWYTVMRGGESVEFQHTKESISSGRPDFWDEDAPFIYKGGSESVAMASAAVRNVPVAGSIAYSEGWVRHERATAPAGARA